MRYFVLVQATGKSSASSMFLMPNGKFDRSRVISTCTPGLVRGDGDQEYHSLIGATKVGGRPLVIGLAASSMFTRAGKDGQFEAPNCFTPRKSLYHCQLDDGKPEM